MLGNVARVCRRPLEGRLNWYECERARTRKKERRKEGERGRTRHPAEGRGEDDMRDREGKRERKID